MRRTIRKGAGSAFNYIVLTVMMFAVGGCWLLMTMVYEQGFFPAYDQWTSTTTVNHTRADQTAEKVKSNWYAWPIVMMTAFAVGMIITSMRSEPGSYQY